MPSHPMPSRTGQAALCAATMFGQGACAATPAIYRIRAISSNRGHKPAPWPNSDHRCRMPKCRCGAIVGAARALRYSGADRRGHAAVSDLPDQHVPDPAPAQCARLLSRALGSTPLRAAWRHLHGPARRTAPVPGRQRQAGCQSSASFAPEAIAAMVGHEPPGPTGSWPPTLDITNARIRALLFRLTEEVRHPGFAADRMLRILGGELAIELARFCLEVDERPATGGLAGWRLRLIDERLSDDPAAPSLSELAGMCNLSVRQLTRGFKVSRGCSIGDYVEQRRMESGQAAAGRRAKASRPSPSPWAFPRHRASPMPSAARSASAPASSASARRGVCSGLSRA